MKKLLIRLFIFASIFVVTAAAQSVVDAARQSRARQKAHPNAPVIDNDVIPSSIEASSYAAVATPPSQATADAKTPATADSNKPDAKSEAKADSDKPAATEDEHKKAEDLKAKIADQKKEIKQLERELNVAQREAGVRAAVYYADAGTMLRDSAKFSEDSRNLKSEIDTKTQALADARAKLEDLQEQARKAGISGSQLE